MRTTQATSWIALLVMGLGGGELRGDATFGESPTFPVDLRAAPVAGIAFSESPTFPVDLLTVPVGGTTRVGQSAGFSVDLRWVRRAWADSESFIADTNAGDVLIYAAQANRSATGELVMVAIVNDTRTGRVIAGTFTWSLRNGANSELAAGNLAFDVLNQAWIAVASVPALPTGAYTILYSVTAPGGRAASRLVSVSVGGGAGTVGGTVTDGASGAALANAQIALFAASAFWNAVQTAHGGVVPPIATLVSEIGSVRGPDATGAGGTYAWADVPVGGPYVVAAEKSGYARGYSASFSLASGVGSVTHDIALYPDSVPTLAALSADVEAVRNAAESLLEHNASTAGNLSRRWHEDDIYEYNFDWLSLAGTVIGTVGGGLSSIPEGVTQTTSAQVLSVGTKVIDKLLETATLETVEYIRVLLTQNAFPADQAGYLASQLHQPYATALDEAAQDFQSQAASTPLANDFSRDQARRLARQLASQVAQVVAEQFAYVPSPEPSEGLYGFSLDNMARGYERLSGSHRTLKITKKVLSGVQIVGGAIVIGAAALAVPTGGTSGAVVAVAAVATKVAGFGKTAVSLADLAIKADMGLNFATAICGTYPQDNDKAVRILREFTGLLETEAANPFYLHAQNRFAADLSVDMNFPFGEPILWTLGLFGYDTAHNTATVTIHDRSTIGAGARPMEVRCVGYGVWSPIALVGSPDVMVVSSEVRGPTPISTGGTVRFGLPYRGFSRGFLSQLKPHYLQVNAYLGPWLVGSRYEAFFVLTPGELLTGPFLSTQTDSTRQDRIVASAAVTRQGTLAPRDLAALATGTQPLADFLLSAATPVQTVPLAIEEQLFAADIRVFAPSEAGVAVLVTDANGAGLGQGNRI